MSRGSCADSLPHKRPPRRWHLRLLILPGARYWIIFAACILLLVLIVRQFARIPLERPAGNLDPTPSLFDKTTA